jgi:hypothetical protein
LAELTDTNPDWPFEDRVLVWLGGHWLEDIAKYHDDGSRGMTDMLQEHQIEHLDEHYLHQLQDWLALNDK